MASTTRAPPGFQDNQLGTAGSLYPPTPPPRTKSRSVNLPGTSPPGASLQGSPRPCPVPTTLSYWAGRAGDSGKG